MAHYPTIPLIDSLIATLQEQLKTLDTLEAMEPEKLHTRPDPHRWSVAEVVEHMVLTSGHYLKELQKIYQDPGSRLRWSESFRPGYFGEMGVHAMRPGEHGKISWKMKTLGIFEPRSNGEVLEPLQRFRHVLEGFIELLGIARTRGLEGRKVVSTLGPILRFKAGDAFRFPIAHQERHFLQIQRTLEQLKDQ